MRIVLALCLTCLTPAAAFAQTSAATAAAPKAQAYSTSTSDIGTLLDNPATKAVLQKHIPEVVNNEQIAGARGMTLKSIQQYAGGQLSDDVLAKIDADLAKIPAK